MCIQIVVQIVIQAQVNMWKFTWNHRYGNWTSGIKSCTNLCPMIYQNGCTIFPGSMLNHVPILHRHSSHPSRKPQKHFWIDVIVPFVVLVRSIHTVQIHIHIHIHIPSLTTRIIVTEVKVTVLVVSTGSLFW